MSSASSSVNTEAQIQGSIDFATCAQHPIPHFVPSGPSPSCGPLDQVHSSSPVNSAGSDNEGGDLKEAGGGGDNSKSAANNRKRIVIKPIADERSRIGTYNKRKFGVIKKAMELSILCNCKIGLFIFSESGKPVRYCSDGDFRSLLNSVVQSTSGPARPGASEIWDNSLYSNFNRGFGSSGKGDDDDFTFDPSMLQAPQAVQGGSAKRQHIERPNPLYAGDGVDLLSGGRNIKQEHHTTPPGISNPLPLGMVAPPLRVASPLVLSAASTMHNRSQVSLGPSFSAAPVPYSTSLDEDFMNSHQSRLPHFLFEDNAGDRASQMPNGHSSMAANCYGVMLNSSFNAPEFDDSTSFKSSHSEHLGSGIQ